MSTADASATVRPLSGVRVLAFEHAWSAPYGTMMLADMGADVVKVETPGIGDHVRKWTRNDLDGLSPHFLSANRNKRSIVVDLKHEEGLEVARRLAAEADLVVENFSPGVMDRLGLGWPELSELNPRLLYCSVNGFGSTGPFADRRAYDLLVQAEGGLVGVTGTRDGELTKVGVPVVDIMAAMVAAFSCVCALAERERTGKGRRVDVSMLEVAVSSMSFNLFSYGISGLSPQPLGTAHPLLAPYEVYPTADGEVAIGILTEAHWKVFCDLVDQPSLVDDPRFVTAPMRVDNRDDLNEILRPVLAKRSADDWRSLLTAHGLACSKVNTVEDLLEHEQLRHRRFLEYWSVGGHDVLAPGAPWYGPHTEPVARTLPPALGQHTDEVLTGWLGSDAATVADLRSSGAVSGGAAAADRGGR